MPDRISPSEALPLVTANAFECVRDDEVRPSREEWLKAAAYREIAPCFETAGYPFPGNVRFACGFPSGDARIVIGQCWDPRASADGTFEIFVSPCLAERIDVLGVLVHEMTHAAVGIPEGHGGAFAKCAKRLGLIGPMPSTIPGDRLWERLNTVAERLGPYPHARSSEAVAFPRSCFPLGISLVGRGGLAGPARIPIRSRRPD